MLNNQHFTCWMKTWSYILFFMLMVTSCYNGNPKRHVAENDTVLFEHLMRDTASQYTKEQIDSAAFSRKHHYGLNYNFVVKKDSVVLINQQPEEALSHLEIDSCVIKKHEHVVVADFRIIPSDSIDSVWIQVASDNYAIGWLHESTLLKSVVPDDPISQFISIFSDIHLLIFLIVIFLISFTYLIRMILRNNAKIVHFNDIDSFYPTLLALIIATAATFYASIQHFAPDSWREFYYQPTLNPFSVPPIISIFLISVWFLLIVGIAAIDETLRRLSFGDAIIYLSGLVAICAIDYIIFSISTLYYIGYILLVVYYYFAIRRYFKLSHRLYYECGHCGALLTKKGKCEHCGYKNV